MPSDDDYADGQYFQADPVPRAPNPAAVAAAQQADQYQPRPQRFQGQGQVQQAGRYLNPNIFQAGFGGHAMARPPASAFRRQYRAYSTAILEIQQGRGHLTGGRANVMYGGKSEFPARRSTFSSSPLPYVHADQCDTSTLASHHASIGPGRTQ